MPGNLRVVGLILDREEAGKGVDEDKHDAVVPDELFKGRDGGGIVLYRRGLNPDPVVVGVPVVA
jgi:hypothetical protein